MEIISWILSVDGRMKQFLCTSVSAWDNATGADKELNGSPAISRIVEDMKTALTEWNRLNSCDIHFAADRTLAGQYSSSVVI